jgi:hypothetical protein
MYLEQLPPHEGVRDARSMDPPFLKPSATPRAVSFTPRPLYSGYLLDKMARGGAVGWSIALKAGSLRVRYAVMSLEFSSGRTMSLGYHEYLLGGKGGQYLGVTTLPPSCADFLESGTLRVYQGLYKDCCTFTYWENRWVGPQSVWTRWAPESVWTRWPTTKNPCFYCLSGFGR